MKPTILLALLLIASASAQLEPLTDGISPSVSISAPSEATFSVENPASLEISLENTGPGTQTPLDQPTTFRLTAGPMPEGWTAQFSPSEIALLPGESGTVRLEVASTPDGATEGTVEVRAFGETLNGLPIALSGEDSASISLERNESATRTLMESLGAGVWALLALLLLTILAAIILFLRSSRKVIEMHVPSGDIHAKPGTKITVPVHIRNLGKACQVVLDASEAPKEWAAFFLSPEIKLAKEATEETQFTVILPENASGKAGFVLVAQASVPSKLAEAVVTIHVSES